MHLAWKYPSRHVAIAGFALQFVALIVLALVGQPHATAGIVLAIAMLGLWLFAEGLAGGAADDLPGALLSYCHSRHRGRFQPGTLRDRQRAGVVYSAAAAGLLGTQMFWVVSLAAIIPIFFLLAVRHEPTREDIDALHE